MTGDDLVVRIEEEAGLTRLELFGEIDLSNADVLAKSLDDVAGRGLPVVIDATALEFIDSAGFAAIHRSVVQPESPPSHLVVPPSSSTARSFAVSGLATVLACHESLDEARGALDTP
jgi:anti-anti-sigma factor